MEIPGTLLAAVCAVPVIVKGVVAVRKRKKPKAAGFVGHVG